MSDDRTATTKGAGTLQDVPGYVDPQYLQAMAAVLERHKHRSYDLLHLEPGHRVLDLGCGPATDTINLAARVGSAGMVLGVDHDPAMVAAANQRAEAAGVSGWTSHIQADAFSLPLNSEYFDRVHAERVFQHLLHPEAAFTELVRVTKPGGLILVAEPDWGTLSIDCTQVDLERRYLRFLTEGYFRNGYAGRRLYELCVSHQLDDIGIEVFPVYVTSYQFMQYTLLADQTEPAAVSAGALSQDEIDSLRQEWQRADAEGRFFGSISAIGVAGRKP